MIDKKTKIVATLSEKTGSVSFVKQLYEAGMNVVRINTAHQDIEGAKKLIDNVREVSENIAILIDTKGPEVRTRLNVDSIPIEDGETVYMTGKDTNEDEKKIIKVSYINITRDVKVGDRVLIDDGDVEFFVKSKDVDFLELVSLNSGFIKNRKSVNIPGASIELASVSQKDEEFIKFAIEYGVDFIAHSFVRSKEDVIAVRRILDRYESDIKIIAKIENQAGVDNIDEILDNVYGIMVARGDLAIEINAEKIPRIQRVIVNKCRESKKPVIIATQMLHSMIEHLHPTRAEISDIANAVYIGADALMLSGETAYGKYPVEAVSIMAKVAKANEGFFPTDEKQSLVRINNEVTAALARAAVQTAKLLPLKALVIDTYSGRTARYISAFRGKLTTYTRCYNARVVRELALSYGIKPYGMHKPSGHEDFLLDVPKILEKDGFALDDLVLVIGGSFGHVRGASFIEVCRMGELSNRNNICGDTDNI